MAYHSSKRRDARRRGPPMKSTGPRLRDCETATNLPMIIDFLSSPFASRQILRPVRDAMRRLKIFDNLRPLGTGVQRHVSDNGFHVSIARRTFETGFGK